MGSWTAILLAFALLIPVVGADPAEATPALADDASCDAPPCGWILPYLNIEVADKLPCGGGQIIYTIGPPADCFDILQPGETRTYPAQLVLKWDITEEGTYPKEIGQDIVISFSGTGSNAPWIDIEVTGESMTDGQYFLDDAALVHPDNTRQVTNSQGQQSVWFWFERSIELTFTRTGDPDAASMRTLDQREGVLAYFIKARSSESGPRFKEGFGIEEFRFNACTDAAIARELDPCPAVAGTAGLPDQDVPGITWTALLGILGLAVMLRRR